VIALALLAIMRRRGSRSDRIAGRLGRDWLMAVGGVGVPIVVLAVLFGLVLGTLQDTSPAQSSGGLRIEVTGRQWFWDVRYPDRRVVTANEIHVPVGTPVTILARSEDVIHSFWVPALNRKIDMIPGRTNELSFTADEPGVFRGQCAEFCGLQHANMAFLVSADEPDDFDAWLEAQAKPAATPPTAQQRRGRSVFMSEACSGCHTIAGTQAQGEIGPDLTHLASRSTIAAATLDNDRGDLGGWILDPQHIKPGAKMPGTDLSGPETQAVLDYLQSLK
jgi:cytochrome c oxidase subunit II